MMIKEVSNMALIKCLECGKEISDKAAACPHCGCPVSAMVDVNYSSSKSATSSITTEKKPKKMKMWLMFSAAVLLVAIIAIVISSLPSKYKWNEVILNSVLPEPASEYGSLYTNDADDLYLTIRKMSFSEYEAYVDGCVDKGFSYVVESGASSYTAFNSDGCELDLDYHEYNESMDISLDVRVSGTIKWSNSKLASLLPVPESNVGSIVNDYNYGYEVYVGNTSKAEYDTYIAECEENGFNLNIQKTDTTFYAENELGYELIVEYYECKLIYVDLDVPEGVTDEEETEEKTVDEIPKATEENTNSALDNETDEYVNNSDKKDDTDSSLKELTDSEINDLAVVTLYKQLVAYENKYKNIDAESCKYNVNTIEHKDGRVYVYGVVYFYDKHGSVAKFGDSYRENFTVSMTKYGDVPWCKFE